MKCGYSFRCNIPHCDDEHNPQYETNWLPDVIPYKNDIPMKCHQYEPIISDNSSVNQQYCARESFSNSSIIRCDQNGLVYKTNEVSIVNEVCVLEAIISVILYHSITMHAFHLVQFDL